MVKARDVGFPIASRRTALSELFELIGVRAERYLVAASGAKWHQRFHQQGRTKQVVKSFAAAPLSRAIREAVTPDQRSIQIVRVQYLQRRMEALCLMKVLGPQKARTWEKPEAGPSTLSGV